MQQRLMMADKINYSFNISRFWIEQHVFSRQFAEDPLRITRVRCPRALHIQSDVWPRGRPMEPVSISIKDEVFKTQKKLTTCLKCNKIVTVQNKTNQQLLIETLAFY